MVLQSLLPSAASMTNGPGFSPWSVTICDQGQAWLPWGIREYLYAAEVRGLRGPPWALQLHEALEALCTIYIKAFRVYACESSSDSRWHRHR